MRLDQYLVVNHYYDSRNKAANAVKCGYFTVNGKKVLKPSHEITQGALVEKLVDEKVYVARSAYKLVNAYRVFNLNWHGYCIADLGASTGGFCQVLLENDVRRIYAVDIGTAQLHPLIRDDSRIVNMEHTNARYLNAESFPEKIDAVTADLSFISIKAILPAIYQVLNVGGEAVVLVKPQFEAGPHFLNKNGVVSDRKVHRRVLEEVGSLAESLGFGVFGVAFSGLSGESGNREYLLYLKKDMKTAVIISQSIQKAVLMEENYG